MTTLYRFYGTDAELLYVGVSDDWPTRLKQHSRTQHWFQDVREVSCVDYPDREGAEHAERAAIIEEQPRFNTHFRQPVVGGDGHRLRWECSACNRSITTTRLGSVCVSEEDLRSGGNPIWHTVHNQCLTFRQGFSIPTTSLKTVYDLIDWTCQLAHKPWFGQSNWRDVVNPHRALYLTTTKRPTRKRRTGDNP